MGKKFLSEVDRSRLVKLTDDGTHRQETLDHLAREGVASDRVIYQSRSKYLSYYHGIDIGLDTVPYYGHTTSLDSSWMGVPVVAMVGPSVVGRAGLSQLTTLVLQELVADNADQYVAIAVALARDLLRISDPRANLRSRMKESPLMDGARFAKNIEIAHQEVWIRWRLT